MIRIHSKRATGHYRAGVHHGPTPFIWRDDAFTPEQLRILQKDPQLVVEKVENPAPVNTPSKTDNGTDQGQAPTGGEEGKVALEEAETSAKKGKKKDK
ncbi:MAG: hypothetical protein LBQ51_04660 [Desulfovibrio sp.]|jgi:hypothetical protein|nr:hypothetical protein [Desulfovibrio sp.]